MSQCLFMLGGECVTTFVDVVVKVLELITYIITILGVPAAILLYIKEQSRQREEREYGTYNALDDKYIQLQQLCLEYPALDVFDVAYPSTRKLVLTEEQEKQEEAILLIRLSLFERAFLMYRNQPPQSKSVERQWKGWDKDIMEWLESRSNFKSVWKAHGSYFDIEFYEFYERALEKKDAVHDSD